jgi:hypothetical protein
LLSHLLSPSKTDETLSSAEHRANARVSQFSTQQRRPIRKTSGGRSVTINLLSRLRQNLTEPVCSGGADLRLMQVSAFNGHPHQPSRRPVLTNASSSFLISSELMALTPSDDGFEHLRSTLS